MKAFSPQFLVQEGKIIDFIEDLPPPPLVPLNKVTSSRASTLESDYESSIYSDRPPTPVNILKRSLNFV